MGGLLEFQKAFPLETKRLLWLIGLVFATIILFQRIELPTGNTLWPVFSWGKVSEPKHSSSPIVSNVSFVHETINGTFKNDSSVKRNEDNLDDPFSREVPELIYQSENHTSESNSSSIETTRDDNPPLPPLQQDANFSLALADPPVASASPSIPGPTLKTNSELPPLQQDGNFNRALADPPVASPSPSIPAPTVRTNSELPPLQQQDANFSLALADPPVASPSLSIPGPALKTNSKLPPLQDANISLALADPPVASPRAPIPGPIMKTNSELHQKEVLTLADMYKLLSESHSTPNSMIPRWSMKVDGDLIRAKSLIETGPSSDNGLYAPLYHNASMFQKSYDLMEKMLKVYIYQEGDRRIFHRPPLEGIYASEGWFMKLMEANRHFVTKRPEQAHLFYLPFSSRQLEETLYVRNSHSHKNLIQHLKNYLDLISGKYPFWNRTDGADHFLVACHDWAPSETKRHMSNCIRALCNADVKEGFNFGKDVSLPETYVRTSKNPVRDVGGKPASKRKTLAFYAGNMHGYLRPILLQHWGNNTDPDMQIFGRLPNSKGNRNYIDYMKSSKYCICPRGYEVNSPRVVEAIFYECVPVIISDNFVPPFFETLNWESFAVFVAEKDVPNLKNILVSIPKKTFFRMHMRVKKVQQHFLWHPKPVKYDLFHMTLHSIWYNRVFQFKPR